MVGIHSVPLGMAYFHGKTVSFREGTSHTNQAYFWEWCDFRDADDLGGVWASDILESRNFPPWESWESKRTPPRNKALIRPSLYLIIPYNEALSAGGGVAFRGVPLDSHEFRTTRMTLHLD